MIANVDRTERDKRDRQRLGACVDERRDPLLLSSWAGMDLVRENPASSRPNTTRSPLTPGELRRNPAMLDLYKCRSLARGLREVNWSSRARW